MIQIILPKSFELSQLPTLVWNTGAAYTKVGQRLAAAHIEDTTGKMGVMLVDIDRGLDYFYADCPLERREIWRRYRNDEDDFTQFILDVSNPVEVNHSGLDVRRFLEALAEDRAERLELW